MTPLSDRRKSYQPRVPTALSHLSTLRAEPATGTHEPAVDAKAAAEFCPETSKMLPLTFVDDPGRTHQPLRVGVVLSGGQAPGGHNVITGIFDALHKLHPDSKLIGFLGGPSGIIDNQTVELTAELLTDYRNQGGFDLIGSGRTKIETNEQFQAAEQHCRAHQLDGLVIVGGDDSNTNAALLAEHFIHRECLTRVIGVPKTIDGDLKNASIETSFGFDSATKVYSELVGNVCRDALSAGKYYFFIKLMGRSASHIALEIALKTHPNLTLIGEEVAAHATTLAAITNQIADMIEARADVGKNHGVVLVPEGIIEFIPEFKVMIGEINRLLAEDQEVPEALSSASGACFDLLPTRIQEQLLLERDPHGNVQVSKIESERLLIATVQAELAHRGFQGKFSAQPLFFGYEGRSGLPSNFDCNYCYALGAVAALLIDNGATGYMACVGNLVERPEEWTIAGVTIASMIHKEERQGKQKPVIRKALVELNGGAFTRFAEARVAWAFEDDYRYPGPTQYEGESEVVDAVTETLKLERAGVRC